MDEGDADMISLEAVATLQGTHGPLSALILARVGWYGLDEACRDPFKVCFMAMDWFEFCSMVNELIC